MTTRLIHWALIAVAALCALVLVKGIVVTAFAGATQLGKWVFYALVGGGVFAFWKHGGDGLKSYGKTLGGGAQAVSKTVAGAGGRVATAARGIVFRIEPEAHTAKGSAEVIDVDYKDGRLVGVLVCARTAAAAKARADEVTRRTVRGRTVKAGRFAQRGAATCSVGGKGRRDFYFGRVG